MTSTAGTLVVAVRIAGATPIMWSIGPMEDRPASTTLFCCAVDTTEPPMKAKSSYPFWSEAAPTPFW